MTFYIVLAIIVSIVLAIVSLYQLIDEGDGKAASALILAAILCGAFANTLGNFKHDYNQSVTQVRMLTQDNAYLNSQVTKYKGLTEDLTEALQEAHGELKGAESTLASAEETINEQQSQLQETTTQVKVLKAELQVAKETTQVDRDRMLLLEQENTELRSTLADIQEAVR